MALTDEGSGNGFYMPVAPAYNGGYGNNGFFGGDGWWIILLLLCFNGGWGMGGFGGGYGAMMGMDGFGLYPWLNNSQHISDGFRDQMLNTGISSIGDKITSGFGDVATQLCGGFAGVNASINGAQNAIAQQLYTNQIADLQQSFALQSQLADCCCKNQTGLADVKYTIATENCADRQVVSDGVRDLLAATQAQTQTIIDKLCQLELDGYKKEVDSLRSQLSEAKFAQSQTAQNALIAQGLNNEVDALYNRLSSCPVPTTPVYGRTPIFTCGGNSTGCGCAG